MNITKTDFGFHAELLKLEMISHGSWGHNELGAYESTMDVYLDGGYPNFIEWDIPELEETEHIGLTYENGKMIDYDGIMAMPQEAVELLRELGFDADYADDNLSECFNCDIYFQTETMIDGTFCSENCRKKYRMYRGLPV